MNKSELIGKKLTGVVLDEDRTGIVFQWDGGSERLTCSGDCCSYSWIEGVELPALGFPATVLRIEDLELPAYPDSAFHTPEDSDYLQFYGCKITTDKGEIVIDYRNDSNGYYGGSLDWAWEGKQAADGTYY